MIIRIIAYETEFDEEQDHVALEATLYHENAEEIRNAVEDMIEHLGIEEGPNGQA